MCSSEIRQRLDRCQSFKWISLSVRRDMLLLEDQDDPYHESVMAPLSAILNRSMCNVRIALEARRHLDCVVVWWPRKSQGRHGVGHDGGKKEARALLRLLQQKPRNGSRVTLCRATVFHFNTYRSHCVGLLNWSFRPSSSSSVAVASWFQAAKCSEFIWTNVMRWGRAVSRRRRRPYKHTHTRGVCECLWPEEERGG